MSSFIPSLIDGRLKLPRQIDERLLCMRAWGGGEARPVKAEWDIEGISSRLGRVRQVLLALETGTQRLVLVAGSNDLIKATEARLH